jgi:hypothetical protein
MGFLIGQAAGALGFLSPLSSGLGASGAGESTGQNFAQAASSNTAGIVNPLATALNPLVDGLARNAPLPNALAPDTINALFAAQSQGSPPANSDSAGNIASAQSEVSALPAVQAGEANVGGATAASLADSSQGTNVSAPTNANNFLDRLMQHQMHALGSFIGQSVSVSV